MRGLLYLLTSLILSNITVALRNGIHNLNPTYSTVSAMPILANIYDPLLRIAEGGKIAPGAAKSWVIRGREVRFHIDSRFNDGSEVSGQHFVKRVEEILRKSNFAHRYFFIEGAEAFHKGEVPFEKVGVRADRRELVIRFRMEYEDPIRMYGAALAFVAFVPLEDGKFNGPFFPVKLSKERALLKRNPYYPGVKSDEVEFLVIKDNFTAASMLIRGELHLLPLAGQSVNRRVTLKGYATNFRTNFLLVNTARVKRDLRRAIAFSIDREELCSLLKGSTPAYSYIPPGYPGYMKSFREEAGEHIFSMKASAEEGEVRLLCSNSSTNLKIAQYLKERLKEVGIKVRIEALPFFMKEERIKSKEYDIAISSWMVDHAGLPFDFFTMLGSDAEDNFTNWKNKRYDTLLGGAGSSFALKNAYELLVEAESLLCGEYGDFPIIPLYFRDLYYAKAENLEGEYISTGASSPDLRKAVINEI